MCFQSFQNCTVTHSVPVLFCDIFVHWLNWRKVLNISQSLANIYLEFHHLDQQTQNLKHFHFPKEVQFTYQCSSEISNIFIFKKKFNSTVTTKSKTLSKRNSIHFSMSIWATGPIALWVKLYRK